MLIKNLNLNGVIKLLLIFLFIVNVSSGLFSPILAVFVTGSIIGATLKTVGFATAIYAIVKSVIQIPLARRLDKKIGEKDDFYVLLIGAIMTTIYIFCFIFIKTPIQLYVSSVAGGISVAFLMAAYYGIFARHVDRGREGYEWSMFSAGGLTLSVALGGAVGGVMADALGFKAVFLWAGILSIVAAALLIFLYPYLIKNAGENKQIKT